MPQGTTRETLARLEAVLDRTQPASLVFLGDLFHASEAHAPATLAALRAWREAHASLDVVLVEGNHDLQGRRPSVGSRASKSVRSRGASMAWRSATTRSSFPGRTRSPATCIPPCASADAPATASGCRASGCATGSTVLPAFGSFTGGARFDREAGDRVVAIAEDRLYEVPSLRDAA